jgi:hypothetical protein
MRNFWDDSALADGASPQHLPTGGPTNTFPSVGPFGLPKDMQRRGHLAGTIASRLYADPELNALLAVSEIAVCLCCRNSARYSCDLESGGRVLFKSMKPNDTFLAGCLKITRIRTGVTRPIPRFGAS